jgi:acetyl-CoA C-acetyltransferase
VFAPPCSGGIPFEKLKKFKEIKMNDVVVLSAKRTPIGSFNGVFTGVPSPTLGAHAIRAALTAAGVTGEQVTEVVMGCVLSAALGQAPARQASLGAGIPESVGCTTVSKVCGSGMKAVMQACDAIKAGSASVMVAGGMESMTNAPYMLTKARGGYRYGHGEILDHMALDGLQNAADRKAMGEFGEVCADKYSFSRADQDAFSKASVERAVAAMQAGAFNSEIVPVTVAGRKGDVLVAQDEEPGNCDLSKIPALKPAFKKDGTLTAASSSKISDGAAALVLADAAHAQAIGASAIAKIVGHLTHAQAPEWFTTAPVLAISKLMQKCNWSLQDVDLFEVNEAFAVVAMAAMKDLGIAHEKINVNGGACALGHPIGASGARVIVTLIHALKARGLKRGIASLCIGGGEATAIAIEII